jgi:hypothetical protein
MKIKNLLLFAMLLTFVQPAMAHYYYYSEYPNKVMVPSTRSYQCYFTGYRYLHPNRAWKRAHFSVVGYSRKDVMKRSRAMCRDHQITKCRLSGCGYRWQYVPLDRDWVWVCRAGGKSATAVEYNRAKHGAIERCQRRWGYEAGKYCQRKSLHCFRSSVR